MRFQCIQLHVISWVMALALTASAQSGKMAIGLDYGSSFIQQGSLWVVHTGSIGAGDIEILPSGTLIPQNVRGRLELGLGSNWGLRVSAGYGYTKQKSEINGANYGWGAKFTASGFPVEGAMLCFVPLSKERRFGAHFGLGGGYYSYRFESEGFNASSSSPNPLQNFSEEKMTISGPAQFFIAGFSIGITAKMRATFELSKLGLSWLKEKRNYEYTFNPTSNNPITYTEMHEDDYHAGSGFDDVALSFGLSMNLK